MDQKGPFTKILIRKNCECWKYFINASLEEIYDCLTGSMNNAHTCIDKLKKKFD